MTNPGLTPARRKLLRGAAWAAPAALVTATAPAIAASPFTRTFAANRPSATSATAVTTRWTVPAGVTRIRVDVVGAGGGGGPQSQGGSGARITGELSVAPGQTVEMIAGAGGSRDPANDAAVAGGGGHGAGGNSPAYPGAVSPPIATAADPAAADPPSASPGRFASSRPVGVEVLAAVSARSSPDPAYGEATLSKPERIIRPPSARPAPPCARMAADRPRTATAVPVLEPAAPLSPPAPPPSSGATPPERPEPRRRTRALGPGVQMACSARRRARPPTTPVPVAADTEAVEAAAARRSLCDATAPFDGLRSVVAAAAEATTSAPRSPAACPRSRETAPKSNACATRARSPSPIEDFF